MKAIVQSYNEETGKAVLLACVPFKDLIKKAKFTHRISPTENPYRTDSTLEYQRVINPAHLNEIVSFLKKVILNGTKTAVFPSSMLVSYEDLDNKIKVPLSGNILDFEIEEACYIVDGQHRLAALDKLYNEINSIVEDTEYKIKIKQFLDNYLINCTILLNFDMWEQSLIFADVNFKQKRVNKSLYYDIYGSFYSDDANDYRQNAMFLAHSLVKTLNADSNSPLYHQIKMLGVGKGIISQAFIVESLLLNISSPRGIWYIGLGSEVSKKQLAIMKIELFSFLHIFKEKFPEYWLQKTSNLCKTTGLGAVLRLMGYIHCLCGISDITDKFDINNIFDKTYIDLVGPQIEKLLPYSEELFSTGDKGLFKGTGGKGLEMSLYKKMVEYIKTSI